MSEPRTDEILRQLREKAPPAPPELRERIRALPEPAARSAFRPRLRPALAAAAALAVLVGLGAAVVNGLTGSSPSEPNRSAASAARAKRKAAEPLQLQPALPYADQSKVRALRAGVSLPPSARLQRYDVAMRIRVKNTDDLSAATKRAMRSTRRLGGYVVTLRYATPQDGKGDASLVVRVPIVHVQEAIMRFSGLGTIVSQQIALADLQGGLDRLDRRIAAIRKVITRLEAQPLSPEELDREEAARRTLTRLTRTRARLVREGTYAKVSVALTTRKPSATKHEAGRFDRFRGDAGDILGKEVLIVLYALVVAGPFALLAAIALLGERTRRRRADQRLLERTGAA